jgi:hypothetical protein
MSEWELTYLWAILVIALSVVVHVGIALLRDLFVGGHWPRWR